MPTERQYQALHRNQRGFTLVELMVTVAVIGILAVVAAPSMTDMVNNGRTTSQAEELVSSLQLARAEAVRRNARVTICAGAAGACNGSTSWGQWTMFGRDNTAAAVTTDVIRNTTLNSNVQVTGPAAGIVFKSSGRIDATQQLQVSMSTQKRCLTVLISGVVAVTKGVCV